MKQKKFCLGYKFQTKLVKYLRFKKCYYDLKIYNFFRIVKDSFERFRQVIKKKFKILKKVPNVFVSGKYLMLEKKKNLYFQTLHKTFSISLYIKRKTKKIKKRKIKTLKKKIVKVYFYYRISELPWYNEKRVLKRSWCLGVQKVPIQFW